MKKRCLPAGRHNMSPDELAFKVGRERTNPLKRGRILPERTNAGSLSFGAPWREIMLSLDAKVKHVVTSHGYANGNGTRPKTMGAVRDDFHRKGQADSPSSTLRAMKAKKARLVGAQPASSSWWPCLQGHVANIRIR
jgi:hypothetical protein